MRVTTALTGIHAAPIISQSDPYPWDRSSRMFGLPLTIEEVRLPWKLCKRELEP